MALSLLLNAQSVGKSFGATLLFRNVSFTVNEGDRIGLIGPNGSGKSTLLKVLDGDIAPDSGEVTPRKGLHMARVDQDSEFPAGITVRGVLEASLKRAGVPETEHEQRLRVNLGLAGFTDFNAAASALSGGWKKRLAIAEALVQHPDLLLLDEPTNHLDLAGVQWLESLLTSKTFACIVVSHDRYFLENTTTQMAELNRAYPDGILRAAGNYSQFLEAKEEFLKAQARHQEALESRVRVEKEWLRRGPKARATKAKARIGNANRLIAELADVNTRMQTSNASFDFTASGRQTKRLVALEGVGYSYDGQPLFQNLNFNLTAGMRVGLVGPNGSGKTTLMRLLTGELDPESGNIARANQLRITYFEQDRKLDESLTLRRALASDSDGVVYQGNLIHVASWAARFLFTGEQLNQPVSRLSGGERARVRIAQLMLEPADLLLLDEPTNDLDIPTLEILEDVLLEYPGALVLVTHDRYMLDRVANIVLGLDGRGDAATFADYLQWETWSEEHEKAALEPASKPKRAAAQASNPTPKKKLSYLEAREWATLEERITAAEERLKQAQATLEDPSVATDATRLQAALAESDAARQEVDALFNRWAELGAKQEQ